VEQKGRELGSGQPTHPQHVSRSDGIQRGLIAGACAAIAHGHRTIEASEQLMRQSAKLMPRSFLEAPTQIPRERDRQAEADGEARRQTNEERQKTRAVEQVGYSLRSMAEETRVMSQELRWQVQATRSRVRMERECSRALVELAKGTRADADEMSTTAGRSRS
jgi:hypothetical protein